MEKRRSRGTMRAAAERLFSCASGAVQVSDLARLRLQNSSRVRVWIIAGAVIQQSGNNKRPFLLPLLYILTLAALTVTRGGPTRNSLSMISAESITFLKKLLDTPGPSGFEAAPAKIWREQAKKFAKVSGDVAGNSLAEVNADGKPTIMLAGHIDEIGVIINYIDEKGYAYIQPIGGWDPQALIAQRLRFNGRYGDVFGVVGMKPVDLIKQEEREKAAKFQDIWVDLGFKTKKAAAAVVGVGDA